MSKKLLATLLFLCVLMSANAYAQENDLLSTRFWSESSTADVEKTIKNGADANACDNASGMTPLLWAISYRYNLETMEVLIKYGADVNAQKNKKYTALMMAIASSSGSEIIDALIKHGADVNARNRHEWTPLMLASMSNPNLDVIETLIMQGADVKARDKEGKTALDYAKENKKLYGTALYKKVEKLMTK